MQAELKKILTASDFDKYIVALNSPMKEYQSHLPTKISAKVAENFIQFIKSKQGSHVSIAFEKKIKDLED